MTLAHLDHPSHGVAPRETPLADALAGALDRRDGLDALAQAQPADRFDAMAALLQIHDLWLAPLPTVGGRERFQNHPAVAALKWRLETAFIDHLDAITPRALHSADPVDAMRRIARHDRPAVYDWLAATANWSQLVRFLAIEGGPDAGFDDLVAVAQVGVRGPAKVVLGANYWDEMGRGRVDDVHTVLHDRLVAAVNMPSVPLTELPLSALDRTALNGLLATNRWLQPELIGALGLLELQAGPRCRQVVRALERLRAPSDAFPFYEEHATTDPRHGKEWLDEAVRPLVEEHPDWGAGIVRGAAWRAAVNARFFDDAYLLLTSGDVPA